MSHTNLRRAVLRVLNSIDGCKSICFPGGAFGEAGTPDILGCYRGRMFCIEVKTGSGRLTALQARRVAEWEAAGAAVTVARDGFDAVKFLEELSHDT